MMIDATIANDKGKFTPSDWVRVKGTQNTYRVNTWDGDSIVWVDKGGYSGLNVDNVTLAPNHVATPKRETVKRYSDKLMVTLLPMLACLVTFAGMIAIERLLGGVK